jgi:ribosomal protein S18 acetylase RimI-like enzyme
MKFISAAQADIDDLFLLYKETLRYEIEPVYGWDEAFQKQRFHESYKLEWLYWLVVEGERIGYSCHKTVGTNLHIHLVIIQEHCRNRGFGSDAVARIESIARRHSIETITLAAFKSNIGAIRLYERLSFEHTGDDEFFVTMEKRL